MDAPWWQRGVIYQIYPRSFADSNGDGIGDLAGIASRLEYLRSNAASSLGVDAIWLSPFYPSPMADFGYDVADYMNVDPVFGTLDDFDALLAGAHALGLRVIIDWVPNHTSNQHPWFIESRASRANGKRNWYVWRDPKPDGGPPNNWRSAFNKIGPAWTLDEITGQYYLHSFSPQQPDLDWENPDVEAAMHDVLRFWLDRGVDGFRLDAIHKIAKDPLLGDNEDDVCHDEDWATIHDRLRRIRAVVDEYDGRMIVGEVYLRDLRRLVEYINTGDQLHLAHNFIFVHLPWHAGAIQDSAQEFESLAGHTAWPAWFLENHDHPRVATRYGESQPDGERKARAALMLICTLRGTPFIYQGQELGLADTAIPAGQLVDVDGRDPERTPIPWSCPSEVGPGAGFTTGSPWLPVSDNAERLCIEAQTADPASTLRFARRLIAMRARNPALQTGEQRWADAARDVLCYTRHGETSFLVALNLSSRVVPLDLKAPPPARAQLEISTHFDRHAVSPNLEEVVLNPDEGIVLHLVRDRPTRQTDS
jgi:alpha-glucosidase